jgi:hypothetical protein
MGTAHVFDADNHNISPTMEVICISILCNWFNGILEVGNGETLVTNRSAGCSLGFHVQWADGISQRLQDFPKAPRFVNKPCSSMFKV